MTADAGPESKLKQDGVSQEDDWVTIARLLRTRGRRGELSGVSLSSHPERFDDLEEVTLFGAEGFPDTPRRFVVEETWEHGSRLIFKFKGIDSISDAERLRGAEVRVPAAERFRLPAGEYYHSDLIGCEVIERKDRQAVGRVKEFLDQGGNGLLQVFNEQGQEILIPFRKEICVEIDVAGKRIEVDLPEGLVEVNIG